MTKDYSLTKQFWLAAGLLALSKLPAHAQADFRVGYVVPATGDTLRGQVDYRGARQGAQQCVFRPAVGAAATTYQPTQLRGYGLLSGEHFVSRPTPIGEAASPASGVASPTKPTSATRVLFLEVAAEGAALLLTRTDEQGRPHYYVQKATAPVPTELVLVRQLVPDGNGQREQQLPLYRGTLTEQFADCPAVLLSLSRTAYTRTALVAAVQRYNACREPGRVQPAAAAPRSALGFEALLGVQFGQTRYHDHSTETSVPAGAAPEAGLALHLGPRVSRQKLTFRLELHYVQQTAQASYQRAEYQPGPNRTVTTAYDLRFKTAYLRLPVLVRYTLPGGRVRPFLEAGGSFSYATQLDAQQQTTSAGVSAGWQPLFNSPYMPDAYRRYEVGYLAGAGVQVAGLARHPVAVLGRVERSDGFTTYVDYATPVVRTSVLVSIGLTKEK